jgi:hypothetical protein
MIFEELFYTGCSVARLATVSGEWQANIEKKTFSRITVTRRRLTTFGTMTRRNVKLVKHLWFCIELPEYDCSQCEQYHSEEWHDRNNDIIEGSIRILFRDLSTWLSDRELVLDVSIYSPSDTKHHFKNLHIDSDVASKVDSACSHSAVNRSDNVPEPVS